MERGWLDKVNRDRARRGLPPIGSKSEDGLSKDPMTRGVPQDDIEEHESHMDEMSGSSDDGVIDVEAVAVEDGSGGSDDGSGGLGAAAGSDKQGSSRAVDVVRSKRSRDGGLTDELFFAVCMEVEKGVPLPTAMKRFGVATMQKEFYLMMAQRPEMMLAYRMAKSIGMDALAAEALQIADTPRTHAVTRIYPDGTKETLLADHIQHRKLQVDTRLRLLAKWDPGRYGDRVKPDGQYADNEPAVLAAQIERKGKSLVVDPVDAYKRMLGAGDRVKKQGR